MILIIAFIITVLILGFIFLAMNNFSFHWHDKSNCLEHVGGLFSGGLIYYCYKCNKYLYEFVNGIDLSLVVLEDKDEERVDKKYKLLKRNNEKTREEVKVKKMKRMPRIFRYAIYLGIVVLFWRFVNNIDQIIGFIVNLLIK